MKTYAIHCKSVINSKSFKRISLNVLLSPIHFQRLSSIPFPKVFQATFTHANHNHDHPLTLKTRSFPAPAGATPDSRCLFYPEKSHNPRFQHLLSVKGKTSLARKNHYREQLRANYFYHHSELTSKKQTWLQSWKNPHVMRSLRAICESEFEFESSRRGLA